jgi:hypothetical protein
MRAVTKPIVLAVAGVLVLGLVTAAAADSHGAAVSALAKAKALNGQTLTGKAFGQAVSSLAKTNGGATNANNAHGAAVKVAATGTAVAAHNGATTPNHGGAVILVAHKPATR